MSKKSVVMGHGSGGRLSQELFETIFLPHFQNPMLNEQHDGAVFSVDPGKLAFSTDSFVVQPLFFPGGNIGDLAINGTVNDLAMCGAIPRFLSVGFILEEGFPLADLKKIVQAMQIAAQEADVAIVTGDTKVVEKGKGDGVFINTSGVGDLIAERSIAPSQAKAGDVILINGFIGDHGIAIMSEREGLTFETTIESDSAPLNSLIQQILETSATVHVLRDPTRGGLAATLNEIAQACQKGILLEESQIPIRPEVTAACEILGLDPLHIANEGKCLVIVPEADAETILAEMHQHPFGAEAAIIGRVLEAASGEVYLKTTLGSHRVVDMPSGEQLPRIC